MSELVCTLLADGSSDSVLIRLLHWLLQEHTTNTAIDFYFEPRNHLSSLGFTSYSECIKAAVDLFPCDLLFLHRDAERETRPHRVTEIDRAIQEAELPNQIHICVIPIRMTEAWFLFHEQAIREVSGNPNGDIQLDLPRLNQVESIPDPKEILDKLIKKASELSKRRLKKSRFQRNTISNFINDYSPLRRLSAFQALENDLKNALTSMVNTHPNQ